MGRTCLSKNRFFLALLCCAALAAAPLERQPPFNTAWITHGPASGGFSALTVDPANPATLYASTSLQGLLKSEDGGDHWRPINRFGSGNRFGPFALAPSSSRTLYAFESNDSYRSDDGGENWVAGGRVPDAGAVFLVVVDPADPSTVYAATAQNLGHGLQRGALYKSRDAGQNWVLSPLSSSFIGGQLAINPVHPLILYAAGGQVSSLYRSQDGGASWKVISPPEGSYGAVSVALDPTDPSTVYGSFLRQFGPFFIARSRDGGDTWTKLTSPFGDSQAPTLIQNVAVDPRNPLTIYAGTEAGLYRSDDSGMSWQRLTGEVQAVVAIDPVNSSTLYGIPFSSPGGAKSTDRGATWKTLETGEIATWISALAVPPGRGILYAVGYGASQFPSSYRSDDGGVTWTASRTGLPNAQGAPSCLAVDPSDPSNPSRLLAGWSGYSRAVSPGLFKSETGGLTWSGFGEGLPDFGVLALAIDPLRAATMYAGTFDGVYRSDDAGATWRPSNAGQSDVIVALAIDSTDSARLYAAGTNRFFHSVDGGATWSATPLVMGTVPYYVRAIAIDPSRAATLYVATSLGLLKSSDGAASWSAVAPDFFGDPFGPDLLAVAIDPRNPNSIVVGTRLGRVFRSRDGGQTWEPFERGLPPAEINALAFDSARSLVHAATGGRGVYDISLMPARSSMRMLQPR